MEKLTYELSEDNILNMLNDSKRSIVGIPTIERLRYMRSRVPESCTPGSAEGRIL